MKEVCRKSYAQLRVISKIRHCMDAKSLETIIHAFVTTKLDFGNATLAGVPKRLLAKLQLVQNAAARLISRTPKYEHITPVLSELHWLPVEMRIKFKILLTVFKCISGSAPSYLCDMIQIASGTRPIRTVNERKLVVPPHRSGYAKQCFNYAGPSLWNELPVNLRLCDDFMTFKSLLKTHLFSQYFSR